MRPTTPSSALNPIVEAELLALGVDASRPFLPSHVIAEALEFIGVITDNAVTAADLTAAGVCVNAAFQQMFGAAADPAAILRIRRFKLELEAEGVGDTLGLIADVMQNVYVRHQKGNRDFRKSMGPFVGTYHTGYAVADTTTAGANQIRERVTRQAVWLELDEPIYVNMRSDTFEVGMLAPVNVAANIQFHLTADAHAWREAHGEPIAAALAELDKAAARQRAAERTVERRLRASSGQPV